MQIGIFPIWLRRFCELKRLESEKGIDCESIFLRVLKPALKKRKTHYVNAAAHL